MNEQNEPIKITLVNRISHWLSNHANPMLVRTIRQEMRSRSFIGIYVLLLVVAAMAAILSASAASESANSSAGRGLYSALAAAWSLVIAIQAMTTFQAVTRERNEDTWDLLDLTGMGPRPVLRGLLFANLVQGQLYMAALAPFLVMAYLLRGIDLIAIAFALIVMPLAGIATSTLAVFMASIGNNKASRAFCQGILGLGLFSLWALSCAFWFAFNEFDWFFAGFFTRPGETWLLIGIWFNMWLAFVIAMLVLSGALMTHRASDRSSGPRMLWYGLWLNTLLWLFGVAIYQMYTNSSWERGLNAALGGFSIFGIIWASILGLFSVSEDYELSPRQERTMTRAPSWRKWATLIHGPGAARGRIAFLVMCVLSLITGAVGLLFESYTDQLPVVVGAWVLFGYIAMIFVVADWCYRGFARKWLDSFGLRRGFILVLAATWILGPILLGLALDSNRLENSYIAMLSPIMGTIEVFSKNGGERDVVLFAVSIGGFAAIAILFIQAMRLRIKTYRVAARSDDKNPRGE